MPKLSRSGDGALVVLRHVIDLGALFAARVSGILIALLFLPLYARLMPVDDFGGVAVVLTFQAAIQVADLGTGMTIAREASRHHALWTPRRHRTRRLLVVSERWLAGVYALVALPTMAWLAWIHPSSGSWIERSWVTALLVMAFALFLVLHHVFNSALVATQSYGLASIAQSIGALARAGATVVALVAVAPTLHVFFATQTLILALHYLWTRRLTLHVLARGTNDKVPASRRHWGYVIRESMPFLLLSGAGAVATQIDKPIIAALVSAAALPSYFLACTYAQTPLAVLSFPISQYFQVRITSLIAAGDITGSVRACCQFAAVLTIGLTAPVTVLIFLAPELTALWLDGATQAPEVAHLTHYLLPGTIVMSFAFVPYVLLTAGEDAGFMARFVSGLTLVVVPAYVAAAWLQGVEAVALVALAYQIAVTAGVWWRALIMPLTASLARASLFTIALATGGLSPWCLTFVLITQYADHWSREYLSSLVVLGLLYGIIATLTLRTGFRGADPT